MDSAEVENGLVKGTVLRSMESVLRTLRRAQVPRSLYAARAVLAGHIAARAWSDRRQPQSVRRTLLHLGFMEAALQTFGRWGMFNDDDAFYPLFLLPNFHGPHFDNALRRLLLPGRGPFAVHLAVTGVCPSRCTYCYASAGGSDAPDLGDERLIEVAQAIAGSGVPLISLGGGEPLSRYKRLLRMVEILAPTSEVRLATSGVGLTAKRVEALRLAGLEVLAVSLDSSDRNTVNTARGYHRAFDSAVAALRCSAEAGLMTLVTTVVDRAVFRDAEQVDDFLAFIREIHPKLVVNFLPKFETGRAVSTGGFRTPEEYAPVAKRIGKVIREHGYRATVFLEPLELLMGCVGGGRRQLNIDIWGNGTTCISGAAFGNVVDEGFEAVCDRFSSESSRLKRGFFCASLGDRVGEGKVLEADESEQALDAFYGAHKDTLFQRALDRFGAQIAWLAGSEDPN